MSTPESKFPTGGCAMCGGHGHVSTVCTRCNGSGGALRRPTMDDVLCDLQRCKAQRAALQAIVDAADSVVGERSVIELHAKVARLDAAIANARAVLRGEAS